MDVGTHALASFVLMRATFPRTPRVLWPMAIGAGILANADGLSAFFGPAAYLNWHLSFLHSLTLAVLVALAALVLMLLVQLLHLSMDLCQSEGILLFWPIGSRRISADWLPRLDPIILALLIVAIFLPELLRLVSAEIGAKEKRSRGQVGASVALSLMFV